MRKFIINIEIEVDENRKAKDLHEVARQAAFLLDGTIEEKERLSMKLKSKLIDGFDHGKFFKEDS